MEREVQCNQGEQEGNSVIKNRKAVEYNQGEEGWSKTKEGKGREYNRLYYIRPLIIRTYPHVFFFQQLQAITVGRITLLKKVSVSDQLQAGTLLQVGSAQKCKSYQQHHQIGSNSLSGRMHNFSRSDAERLKVGCTKKFVYPTQYRSVAQLF